MNVERKRIFPEQQESRGISKCVEKSLITGQYNTVYCCFFFSPEVNKKVTCGMVKSSKYSYDDSGINASKSFFNFLL